MCAENVAKLHDKYVGEVCSRKYVHCFFERFVIGDDRRMMEQAFTDNNDHLLRPLSFKQVVNVLYDVRCDVVHEGNYQDFAFHDGAMPMVNVAPDITANISLADLRAVLVRGCINAVNDRLNTPIS